MPTNDDTTVMIGLPLDWWEAALEELSDVPDIRDRIIDSLRKENADAKR